MRSPSAATGIGSRVVHEHIEAEAPGPELPEASLHGGLVARIRLEKEVALRSGEACDKLPRLGRVPPVMEDEAGPGLGKG